MKALKSICFVFLAFVMVFLFEEVRSMWTNHSERKLTVPNRTAYERVDKTSKNKQPERLLRGRSLIANRYEFEELAPLRTVSLPSERLRRFEIPNRSMYEKLDRENPRSSYRTQKNQISGRYPSKPMSPEPPLSRGNRRIPYSEDELVDIRASLKPPAPDTPPTVKVKFRHGNVIIDRETEVDSVHHVSPYNKICMLEEKDFASVCEACSKVYEKVYGNRKYRALDAPSQKSSCVERNTLFGITWVKVHVRKCPFTPDFYLSQGNGDGWVFVYIPINGSKNLQFRVHLGDFGELLRPRKPRMSRY